MSVTWITRSIYKKIRRVLIPMVLVALFSMVFLAIGVRSALNESQLYSMLVKTGFATLPTVPTYIQPPSYAAFNEFGQLVHYEGKAEVDPPLITKKTMVLFVFGQSNSANHGGEKFRASSDKIYNFWNGAFYRAEDPLLGASGFSGSVWVDLSNKIIQEGMADSVILIPAGIGGSSVRHWQNGGVLNPMLIQRLKQAKEVNLEITHFLWHQGEADQAIDIGHYQEGLDQIIQATKSYFPNSKFFVAQASRCGSMPPSKALQNAQRGLSKQAGVFLGPNTDVIDQHNRYDDCHFSGNGLKLAANAWFNALKENRQKK